MIRDHPEYIAYYNPEADVQSEDYLKRRNEWLPSYLSLEKVDGKPVGWDRLVTWSNVGNTEVIQAQKVLDNAPGTIDEYTNWRIKLSHNIEMIKSTDNFERIMKDIKDNR